MAFVIYKHTSPSGKSYIGQTRDYARRMRAHKSKKSRCTAFASAIKKHGWENFTHEILIECQTLDEANKSEKELIIAHNTIAPNGYNLFSGGDNKVPCEITIERMRASKRNISEETRAKISNSKKGFKHTDEFKKMVSKIHKGRIKSPEERAKLSASLTGKKVSDETRKKMSEKMKNISDVTRKKMSIAAKKRITPPEVIAKRAESLKGRYVSETTKGKISATLKGHPVSEETRNKMSESAKIKVITKETRAKMSATRKANFEAKKKAKNT